MGMAFDTSGLGDTTTNLSADQSFTTVALNADMSCRQKLFHCTFSACRKFFTSRTQLQIHTRTHTGEKPHKCLNCGKAFAQSNNLYRHLRASKECAGTVAIPDDLRSCRY
ncbi:gastrula zinc finger protein 5-1-like isoform X1 [Dreissena polymorpha]|uniref:gastrula zinc finger protein 5-1-like isoform X1 n=1 Tax=Dreissena polymorpha TaxID=45954 RepID=UPI00226475B7|nr:gastrula zinc finger protein 5-1-like isoform X1 [Dreissena polymorpha]